LKRVFSILLFYFLILTAYSQSEKYYEHINEAYLNYRAKQYVASALEYVEAFKEFGWNGRRSDWYNAACSWALAGSSDSAFINLDRIILNIEPDFYFHILKDSDLISLHEDIRWKKLLEKALKNEIFSKQIDSLIELEARCEKLMRDKYGVFVADFRNYIFEEFGTDFKAKGY
jgi:hypothetical protein